MMFVLRKLPGKLLNGSPWQHANALLLLLCAGPSSFLL